MGASSIFAFVVLQTEEFRKRIAVRSTEARIRLTIDLYDIIFASIDDADQLKKFSESFREDIEGNPDNGDTKLGIRFAYEYIMDLDDEHGNKDSSIDDARNELERQDSGIHRRLLQYARVNGILTQESVKEFFGRYRQSWNAADSSGGEGDRRFE